MQICPYCLENEADTDEHIFPEFLGGKREIRSCADCNNNRFGSGFEGAVSRDIKPIVAGLAINGLKPPKKAVWKNAHIEPDTGHIFDLHHDGEELGLHLSRPYEIFDDSGNRIGFRYRSVDEALSHKDRIEANGDYKVIVEALPENESKRLLNTLNVNPINFTIGSDLRRLAVKMCVALAECNEVHTEYLDENTRAYLLDGVADPIPVRYSYLYYEDLEKNRPPLAHLIYIEGNKVENRCFGVVQLFGTIQLYVILNSEYSNEDFAVIGILDSHSGSEEFSTCPPLKLEETPGSYPAGTSEKGISAWFSKMDGQVFDLFGKNVVYYGPDDNFRNWLESQNIFRKIKEESPNGKAPVIWINYRPVTKVIIKLKSQVSIKSDVVQFRDSNTWIFLGGNNEPRKNPLIEFIDKWNAGEIDRTFGEELEYAPNTEGMITISENQHTFELVEFRIEYQVEREAFFGYCDDQLPNELDSSWEKIDDPDQLNATLKHSIVGEYWNIERKLSGLIDYQIIDSNE